jgi:hypothetical protein
MEKQGKKVFHHLDARPFGKELPKNLRRCPAAHQILDPAAGKSVEILPANRKYIENTRDHVRVRDDDASHIEDEKIFQGPPLYRKDTSRKAPEKGDDPAILSKF